MNNTSTGLNARACTTGLIFSLLMTSTAVLGGSLFGDHACQSWQSLGDHEKRSWTNAFLAPLSLTLKGLQKSKQDKFNDDPKASETALRSIDDFCNQNPEMGAADGAGRYLKKLFEMPPS